jgi:hypothetical protein
MASTFGGCAADTAGWSGSPGIKARPVREAATRSDDAMVDERHQALDDLNIKLPKAPTIEVGATVDLVTFWLQANVVTATDARSCA